MTVASSDHSVKIHLDAGGGTVEIDGHRIENAVTGLSLSADSRGARRLVLDVCAFSAEVDGRMTVTIPDETRDALLALGWAPPSTPEKEG